MFESSLGYWNVSLETPNCMWQVSKPELALIKREGGKNVRKYALWGYVEVIIEFLIYLGNKSQAHRAEADWLARFELKLIVKNRRSCLKK